MTQVWLTDIIDKIEEIKAECQKQGIPVKITVTLDVSKLTKRKK